jgi:hypothetical protein
MLRPAFHQRRRDGFGPQDRTGSFGRLLTELAAAPDQR